MSYSPVYHCLPCAMDQGFQRSMWCVGVRDSENKKPNQTRPHQTPTWTSTMKPSRDLGGFFRPDRSAVFLFFGRTDREPRSGYYTLRKHNKMSTKRRLIGATRASSL